MELLKNLFEGYPNLWGGGVAHSVLILSLVIAFGIMLGKIKISGISLGVTWILFVGIVFGHFNLNLNEHLLHFLKEFGLILFVYSIGYGSSGSKMKMIVMTTLKKIAPIANMFSVNPPFLKAEKKPGPTCKPME